MNITLKKADTWGVLSSSLCLVHCIATPFFFLAQTSIISHTTNTPIWWKSLDFIFLIISFFAVYRSSKTTTNQFIKKALWISWCLLFTLIINEKIALIKIPEVAMYIVGFTLVALHIYNLNFCQCKTNNCCTKNEE